MNVKTLVLFAMIIIFLLLPSNITASSIELPMIEDAYAKQYWPSTNTARYPHLALGKSTLYPEKETVPYFTYDMSPIWEGNYLIEEIISASLVINQFQTKTPAGTNIITRGFNGDFSLYNLNWVVRPEITTSSMIQPLTSSGTEKVIDITDIIKEQLQFNYQSGGVEIAMENVGTPGTLIYAKRCTNGTYYQPQCTPDQIPKILIEVDSVAPLPPSLFEGEKSYTNLDPIQLKWSGEDESYFLVEVSGNEDFTEVISDTEWIQEKHWHFEPGAFQDYYWRVKSIRRIGSQFESISTIGIIKISEPTPEPDMPKVIVIEPNPSLDKPDSDESIPIPDQKTKKSPTPQKRKPSPTPIPKPEPKKEVKGEESTNDNDQEIISRKALNNIHCLHTKGFSGSTLKCDKPEFLINEAKLTSTKLGESLKLTIETSQLATITENYSFCDKAVNLHLRLCSEQLHHRKVEYTFTLMRDGIPIEIGIKRSLSGQYILLSEYVYDGLPEVGNYTLNARGIIVGSDISLTIENFKIHPEIVIAKVAKPFAFPFDDAIGVTQWYGRTAFSSNHTGIDFGAIKEKVKAIGDGKIYSVGYDTYNGKCNSGGYYINILHSNGMHSVYMHLDEEYFRKKAWVKGDSIERGMQIAISGNSGAQGCKPLKEHLHLETRESRNQSTCKDPVRFISYDWSRVKTLGIDRVPGRLTGNNPHPTY